MKMLMKELSFEGIERIGNKYRVILNKVIVEDEIEVFVDALLVKEKHAPTKQLALDSDPPILNLTLDRFYECTHCSRTFKSASNLPMGHYCNGHVVKIKQDLCIDICEQHTPSNACLKFRGFQTEGLRRKTKPEGKQLSNPEIYERGKPKNGRDGSYELWFEERFLGTYATFERASAIHKQIKASLDFQEQQIEKVSKTSPRYGRKLHRGLNLPKVKPPPRRKACGKVNPAYLRGVFKTNKGWEAKLRTRDGQHKLLGETKDPIEAALIWDKAILSSKGPEAATNFPAGTKMEDVHSGKVKPLSQKMQKPLRGLSQNGRKFEKYYKNGHLRGVERQHDSYISKIELNGITQHLGVSNNPISAALTYDKARLQLYGASTWTNFPAQTQLLHVIEGKIKPRLLIAYEQRLATRLARESQKRIDPNAAHPWANLRYRGVHKTDSGKYRTRIYHKKMKISCGTYTSVFQAALAWDRKKLELKGDDIWTNFPEGTTEEDILACRVPPNERLIQEAQQEANPEQAKTIEYDEMEDEVFEYLEEQQTLGVKVTAEKIKRVFHIGWSRSKALIARFYRNNCFDGGSSVDEGTFLHRKSDWNRVVGVGSYYQAKVEEWTGKSYNSLARRPIMGSLVPPEEFVYQSNNSIDGRHFSLSRYFINIHGPQYIVHGELLPGQPTVMFKVDGSKQNRSLKTKFRHCQDDHEGPCIYAIPNEVKTNLGLAKLKSFRMGEKFEVELPYGKAYLMKETVEPFLVQHCRENWSTPFIPDQTAKRSLNQLDESSDEGEYGNYIFCVDCGIVVEATFGRGNNCHHHCKAYGGKKISRSFGKRYSKCTHPGPCVHELPLKILTPYGIGKVNSIYDGGRKMKLLLPFAKMYCYEQQFVPWVVQSITNPHLLESEVEEEEEVEERESSHKYGLRKRRATRPRKVYGISSSSSPGTPMYEKYQARIRPRPGGKRKRVSENIENVIDYPRKKRRVQPPSTPTKFEKTYWRFCPHPKCRWATQLNSELMIKQHYKRHNASDSQFFCNVCELGFTERVMRDKHQNEKHKEFQPQKCPVCEALFTEWDAFKEHNKSQACSPKKVMGSPSLASISGDVVSLGPFWLALDQNIAAVGLFTTEAAASQAMRESLKAKCNMCGHVARVVLKNAKLKSEKLAREIAQMAEVYFDGMAGVDNKGLVRVNEIWTTYAELSADKIVIAMPVKKENVTLNVTEEFKAWWNVAKQNAITRVKAEKLEDLILDLRRLNLELGTYPTVSQMKEGKCWKLFQHHAKIVRHFGGRDVIKKFVGAGISIPTELSGEDKDYIPPIALPEENGDHVLYNPIVTTPCTPGSRKRELDYSPRMDAGIVMSPTMPMPLSKKLRLSDIKE